MGAKRLTNPVRDEINPDPDFRISQVYLLFRRNNRTRTNSSQVVGQPYGANGNTF